MIQSATFSVPTLLRKTQRVFRACAQWLARHWLVVTYMALAVLPVLLVVSTLFKTQTGEVQHNLPIPHTSAFVLASDSQLENSAQEAWAYAQHAALITVSSLGLLLVLGLLVAWLLADRQWIGQHLLGNRLQRFFFAVASMVPIRLGIVSVTQGLMGVEWFSTASASVLVYVAQGLPLAVMIFAEFMTQVPRELKDAARCDGVGEWRIFFQVVLPLIQPALATVVVFAMVPIWNDLWSPLLLAQSDKTSFMTLGMLHVSGDAGTDWITVLASLSLAVIPAITLYTFFSRQLFVGAAAPSGR